ncbi:hypothetical protein ADL04_15945 [Streptomyces sp. NRRL B-3648]|nr:hypothetical protein ADL04_15945 [Streptomyces sp. NRRL B-3648]
MHACPGSEGCHGEAAVGAQALADRAGGVGDELVEFVGTFAQEPRVGVRADGAATARQPYCPGASPFLRLAQDGVMPERACR